MADDSVDTSLLNNGIIFCQNPVDGELDYYWDNEAEICCPSLMPDNNVIIEQFSGDSMDLEEKCFQNMANLLNKRDHDNVARNELLSYKESDKKFSFEENDVDMDEVALDDLIKKMTDTLNDNNQELKEREEPKEPEEPEEPEEPAEEPEDPPSPTSPRDPERDGPVLSEEEEDTEEGGIHRLEHDPVFQDEAGLMYGDDSRGEIWPDDEGMDPMENQ
ncbi:hypothetical protein RhiirC2_859652 [Rhizophagus irregularis]|uniref:Uncharacterized protein n=1 Tax=Rhizophagus irregularis TaxID=588596 RepID=A0A2N1P3I6_9GLOM|nr:hypothetical protein RhiirC2_859652 [Rhizophagus irregularis]